jgi:HD-like signal output (HDOD) protein
MLNLNVFSQRVGVLAGKMAKQTSLSKRAQDHAQIAAMMVNLGELIKMTLLTEPPLKEVLGDKANGQAKVDKPELDDGPLIGSYLLGIWALPFPVIEALRWHRDPRTSEITELSPLTIVHAAWSMLSAFNQDQEINLENELIQTDYLQAALGESGVLDCVEIAREFCTVDE